MVLTIRIYLLVTEGASSQHKIQYVASGWHDNGFGSIMSSPQEALEWRATDGFTDRSGGDRYMLDFSKTFVYGSHYWRPPSPPRDMHRHHLTRIKNEMGFDLIKYRMSWS